MSDGAWHYFRVKRADGSFAPPYTEWVDAGKGAPTAAHVTFTLQVLYLGCVAESCTHAEAFGHGAA